MGEVFNRHVPVPYNTLIWLELYDEVEMSQHSPWAVIIQRPMVLLRRYKIFKQHKQQLVFIVVDERWQ